MVFPISRIFSFSSVVNTSHILSTNWILDSGATNHMVHSLNFFTSITSIVQISIRLPNGDMAKVTHIENVLFIPTFSFNLVSISKLIQNLSFYCIFLSRYYFI